MLLNKYLLYAILLLSLLACREEIDKSNRYTFIGETVADFMLNRNEKYSHFIALLKRAELFTLLQTYGHYTLFLPDNEAVEKFVAEQDSIYWTTKETEKPVWTGVTSPFVEELSDSMANVIARMHLIERNYHASDMGEGAIGKWNFNDRALVVSYKVVDERFYIMLNNSAAIIDADNQVENGIIHLIDKPIDSHYRTISSQISEYTYFSIFSQAISATGFADRVSQSVDLNYIPPTVANIGHSTFPQRKYIKFTAFIEPDEVFNKNGIYTLDDLIAFSEKWYGTAEKGNYNNSKNALYKFVAYHFVEGEIPYNRVVPSKSGTYLFDEIYIPGYDLYSYYTTLQGTLLKALKPLSTPDGLNIYLNYSKRQIPYNAAMRNHTNVRVIELTEFTQSDKQYADFVPNAANGLIHPIDKILIYNEDEMSGNILNERMRFNITALQPELSSNNILYSDYPTYVYNGYCSGVKKSGEGEAFWSYTNMGVGYNGGIFAFVNQGDWAIKLPPVPARTYEIRYSILLFGQDGDFFQVYFDDKICGLPIKTDIEPTDPCIGWRDDNDTYDNGLEVDKEMRNKGWMKAPDAYLVSGIPARARDAHLRRIATTAYLSQGEHWIRFSEFLNSAISSEYFLTQLLNYIEIVPLHIISDPTKPEDRH